jgi:hypothetical protein
MVRPLFLNNPTVLLLLLPPHPTNRNGNHPITQHDMKNHKVFLKKIKYPAITTQDLYLGNVLTCYGRQLKIINFADDFTAKHLLKDKQTNKYTQHYPEPSQ